MNQSQQTRQNVEIETSNQLFYYQHRLPSCTPAEPLRIFRHLADVLAVVLGSEPVIIFENTNESSADKTPLLMGGCLKDNYHRETFNGIIANHL